MNREIKFRAWREDTRQMLPSVDLSGPRETYLLLGRSDLPLMQFTGIKARDGREIYEGDIIRNIQDIRGRDYKNPIRVIRWMSGINWIGFNLGTGRPVNRPNKPKYDIIGNVFENPELIPKP